MFGYFLEVLCLYLQRGGALEAGDLRGLALRVDVIRGIGRAPENHVLRGNAPLFKVGQEPVHVLLVFLVRLLHLLIRGRERERDRRLVGLDLEPGNARHCERALDFRLCVRLL